RFWEFEKMSIEEVQSIKWKVLDEKMMWIQAVKVVMTGFLSHGAQTRHVCPILDLKCIGRRNYGILESLLWKLKIAVNLQPLTAFELSIKEVQSIEWKVLDEKMKWIQAVKVVVSRREGGEDPNAAGKVSGDVQLSV
nr:hypothetical protein [Tanacetum cinerariifolium]